MNAAKSSDRTMTVLKILHKYLYREAAAWEEKDADLATKEHLLEVIGDANCVLAQLLDEDHRERNPRIDDTRIFGYTANEFNDLPNEVKRRLLHPLEFTVFEPVNPSTSAETPVEDETVTLPFTASEYRIMPREEAEKAIREAACHMANPVLRYKFKEES